MSWTTTTNYFLRKPDFNTEIDAWGPVPNFNMDVIDGAMKTNADAAVNALNVANTKSPTGHSHDAGAITSGVFDPLREPALSGDVTKTAGNQAVSINNGVVTNGKLAVGTINTVKGTTNGTSNSDVPFATILAGIGAPSIPNDSITNAQLVDMNALSLKGNSATGSANPSDLSVATVMTMLGAASTTQLTDAVTKETQVPISTGTYTLQLSDAGKMVTFSATCALSVNSATAFPAGSRVDIMQIGTGQVTVGGTATARSRAGLKTAGQWAAATIWFISSSEFVLFGDTSV